MIATERKTERIDIRTTLAAKEVLQQAAAAAHKNVSEFLLDVGLAAAKEVLPDRQLFQLNDEDWQAFQEVLDRPVQKKPRLVRLLSESSVIE